MIRTLAILGMSLWACNAGHAQSSNVEIRMRATVQAVVALTSFSGAIMPVDFDPRFALTVRIESTSPAVANFSGGAVVTFCIHSPSLTFGEKPREGKTYDLVLHRKIEDGQVKFFGLKARKMLPYHSDAATP